MLPHETIIHPVVAAEVFHRLNVFSIQIPPLRERADGIPLLVEYLIERYTKKGGQENREYYKEDIDILRTYDRPGNIRGLQNVVERAVILCDGDTFSVDVAG